MFGLLWVHVFDLGTDDWESAAIPFVLPFEKKWGQVDVPQGNQKSNLKEAFCIFLWDKVREGYKTDAN